MLQRGFQELQIGCRVRLRRPRRHARDICHACIWVLGNRLQQDCAWRIL
jgi:hypothetical protein